MDLDELKRLLEKATPGPWDALDDVNYDLITHGTDKGGAYLYVWFDEPIENRDLIIALRNAAPQLIQELEILRKAIYLISIVDQGAGGNLTYEEMAKSAMMQAREARSRVEEMRRRK